MLREFGSHCSGLSQRSRGTQDPGPRDPTPYTLHLTPYTLQLGGGQCFAPLLLQLRVCFPPVYKQLLGCATSSGQSLTKFTQSPANRVGKLRGHVVALRLLTVHLLCLIPSWIDHHHPIHRQPPLETRTHQFDIFDAVMNNSTTSPAPAVQQGEDYDLNSSTVDGLELSSGRPCRHYCSHMSPRISPS